MIHHHGDALRSLLKQEKVTLSELARKLHVHPNTVTNYVQAAEIRLDTWRQIAQALKKELADLVPGYTAAPINAAAPATAYALPAATVPETLSACQKELLRTQAAYITLLQEHLTLVRATATLPPAAS